VLKKCLLLSGLLLCPLLGHSQVAPAGRGGNEQLYVGGMFSAFSPDYGWHELMGIGAYVDANLTPRLGAEAEVRFLRFNQLAQIHADNYLIGPKYNYHHKRFIFYGKGLMGIGSFNFPLSVAHGRYFASAIGGGIDYRLSHRWYVRAIDYEYQIWPGFIGPPDTIGGPNRANGLTPQGFSFGMSYRIF
jgi:hypothetical protein